MNADPTELPGTNLIQGIDSSQLEDGAMLVGHVGEQAVILARRGIEVFALDATCTHYGGPLGEGMLVGDTVRSPWHHACFSLKTGEERFTPTEHVARRSSAEIAVGSRTSASR